MHIVVVEPHCDDAFLSVGWHLQHVWKEEQRTIVTVFSEPKRSSEAKAYADHIGAASIALGLTETPMAENSRRRIIPELRDCLRALQADWLVFPLGLQHPDHVNVALTCPEYNRDTQPLFYVDTPYQTKQKLAEEIKDKTHGMVLWSMYYPGAMKWKLIPIFKSQAKFFHFNPMTNLRIPEIVLCPQ